MTLKYTELNGKLSLTLGQPNPLLIFISSLQILGSIGDIAMERILEAFVGEYASGKSEVAINRALELLRQGRRVKLVDLDLVEPFFTLRPIKDNLEKEGLEVIAWNTCDFVGLGEIGIPMQPQMKWALEGGGDVILDVGYGVRGAETLNLVQGAKEKDLKVYAVINIARPMTATVKDIVEFVKSLGRVDGLINNSHLGDETDAGVLEEGSRIVSEAARILNLKVVATTVAEEFSNLVSSHDASGNPVKIINRYMKNAYW